MGSYKGPMDTPVGTLACRIASTVGFVLLWVSSSGSAVQAQENLCEVCVVGTIECGQLRAGSLAFGDCQSFDGSFVDVYRFELTSASQVTIRLRSSSFDTFLFLEDGKCESLQVAVNDDCEEGDFSHSCITIDLAAGAYYIFVNSYDVGETGKYTLQVSDCSESNPPCARCPVRAIDCEANVTGTLGPSDCDLGDGSFVDIYRVELPTAAQVTARLTSTAFDTFLSVEPEDCLQLNDDCEPGSFDLSCLSVFL